MGKEYVPIFFDWLETTQDLTAEEKGNLIDAVVSYASGQEYEHLLSGMCRVAFRFLKGQVDRNDAISAARSRAGRKDPETNDIKTEQNGSNDNKTDQNGTNDNKQEQNGSNSPKENNNNNKNNNKNKNKNENKNENEKNDRVRALEEAERFTRFWAAYPRHEAKAKAQAAFMKLHPDEDMLAAMLAAIVRQKASDQWREDGGRYIPHPTTWLNGHRWEDETKPAAATGKTVNAQRYDQRDYADAQETEEQMVARLMGRTPA